MTTTKKIPAVVPHAAVYHVKRRTVQWWYQWRKITLRRGRLTIISTVSKSSTYFEAAKTNAKNGKGPGCRLESSARGGRAEGERGEDGSEDVSVSVVRTRCRRAVVESEARTVLSKLEVVHRHPRSVRWLVVRPSRLVAEECVEID